MEKTDCAAVSEMAFRLWRAERNRAPKASEAAAFLDLVAACREALSGKKASTGYNIYGIIGESPRKR